MAVDGAWWLPGRSLTIHVWQRRRKVLLMEGTLTSTLEASPVSSRTPQTHRRPQISLSASDSGRGSSASGARRSLRQDSRLFHLRRERQICHKGSMQAPNSAREMRRCQHRGSLFDASERMQAHKTETEKMYHASLSAGTSGSRGASAEPENHCERPEVRLASRRQDLFSS